MAMVSIFLPPPPQNPELLHKQLSSTLQSCQSIRKAKQIHASLLRNNLTRDLYPKLLAFYTQSPSISHSNSSHYATRLFKQLLNDEEPPSIFMWNTMIRFYANCNSPNQAISLYIQMRYQGLKPNNYTFTFLIKASTSASSMGLGPSVHAQSIVLGMPESDVYIRTALINMYTNGGSVYEGRILFDRMEYRTAATWNAMIAGYAKMGDVESARRLFDEMPEKDEQSWNVMVCGYTRIGDCDVAGRLFDGMPVKTLPTWNAMIAGYAKGSRPNDALALFRQMQLAGLEPDEITLVTVLPACAQLGALELGEWVHIYVEKHGFDRNASVCNALIDMYAKSGCIEKARVVFQKMRERSVVSWNTMMCGLAIHGRGEEAIGLFAEMQDMGVAPDDITFVGLLSACGHAGFIHQAQRYFGSMKEIYGIHPKIEHYGCMVDVLGRACQLDEILELIDLMPVEPNSVILGSLLSACRMCNNSQLGEKVLEELLDMEPLNSGYYVLLSNMYACSRRWNDVIRIRNLMKSRGVEKTPGCSLIEVDNKIHEFVVGDKTHPLTKEIYSKLGEISSKIQSAGYVPDTSVVLFDLDEEEKTQNLSFHSEKLAIAFGLLTTNTGKPIRVVKNLRVCTDCHSAIKIISVAYNREITVRDCNRFHHFKDGKCSCNDYW